MLLQTLVSAPESWAKKKVVPDCPKREFRGAWIQCVNGQYLGKNTAEIQRMLGTQLDVLQHAGINAIIFQVRAEGDALYRSKYEPWSRFLTGKQGVSPSDGWDPLHWMVEQCHQRGMECHAWINPYRAKTKGTTQLASNHIAMQHPEQVFPYDGMLIMNPALESNRIYTCMVVQDIIQRYDVDGIHMDDYFYPYPVSGGIIPDQDLYETTHHGSQTLEDWRRENVNKLVEKLHKLIHKEKPWVKFGISPFGIYRHSSSGENDKEGSATRGLTNYNDLYADVVQWQKKGWVDYLIPQVYWNLGNKMADYEVLCHWWNDYCSERPLFIGQDVERTVKGTDPDNPAIHQMEAKYRIQRNLPHIQGSCQWYAAAVVDNPGNYLTMLERRYHRYPALQPLMPFIDKKKPKKPANIHIIKTQRGPALIWDAPKHKDELDRARNYVVYSFEHGEKIDLDDASHIEAITPGTMFLLKKDYSSCTIVITSLDRLHNESKGKKIKL